MKTPCTPAPTDKKEYITEIGKLLVHQNGKKNYYKPEEVKKAHRKSKWYDNALDLLDFSCWAMSTFSSRTDFDHYHQKTEEVCDYVAMKSEMLHGLSVSSDADWTAIGSRSKVVFMQIF